VLTLVAVTAGAGAYLVLAGGGAPSTAAVRVRSVTTSTSTTTTTLAPTTTTTVDPGTLPQTMDHPSTTDANFQAGLQGFWQSIVTGDPTSAMPFFFPVTAYVQVKAISNPTSDWQSRLVGAYRTDIQSLHAQLGAGASTAQLTGIDVPDTAQWVPPGAEYNKGSYWRVYGAQVHYTLNGAARSFTIASMISWRGRWYIVHLARIA
jgi:hypothetical protein